MGFCWLKFNVWLLIMATGAMILSADAQQAGQVIIFSSPSPDDTQSITPSLVPSLPLPALPATLQASGLPFDYGVPNDFPVLPPSPVNTSERQRMEKMLKERKNWTLMTPAEIFGVTPTEEMLKPRARDALGREKNQTQLERYLDREDQLRTGFTNGWQNDRADSPWNFSRDKDSEDLFDPSRQGRDDAAQNLDRFLNGQRNQEVSADPNGNISWDSFSAPTPQAFQKPNPEQLAAMERFRQLLEPSPAAATPSPDNRFFPVPKAVVDPNITQPDFVLNPAGASFTPMASGIAKPVGLMPLPGLVITTPQPAAAPAWAPQPPPWLLQGPQTFTMPQRKF